MLPKTQDPALREQVKKYRNAVGEFLDNSLPTADFPSFIITSGAYLSAKRIRIQPSALALRCTELFAEAWGHLMREMGFNAFGPIPFTAFECAYDSYDGTCVTLRYTFAYRATGHCILANGEPGFNMDRIVIISDDSEVGYDGEEFRKMASVFLDLVASDKE